MTLTSFVWPVPWRLHTLLFSTWVRSLLDNPERGDSEHLFLSLGLAKFPGASNYYDLFVHLPAFTLFTWFNAAATKRWPSSPAYCVLHRADTASYWYIRSKRLDQPRGRCIFTHCGMRKTVDSSSNQHEYVTTLYFYNVKSLTA